MSQAQAIAVAEMKARISAGTHAEAAEKKEVETTRQGLSPPASGAQLTQARAGQVALEKEAEEAARKAREEEAKRANEAAEDAAKRQWAEEEAKQRAEEVAAKVAEEAQRTQLELRQELSEMKALLQKELEAKQAAELAPRKKKA